MQAVGQICSTSSMAHNLDQCVKLMGKAAEAGAEVRILFRPDFLLRYALCPWSLFGFDVGREKRRVPRGTPISRLGLTLQPISPPYLGPLPP